MTSEIGVGVAAEQLWAAVRQRTTVAAVSREIQPLLVHAWETIGRHPELSRRGRNVALYHPDGSVEVGVEVSTRFEDEPEVHHEDVVIAAVAHAAKYDLRSGAGQVSGRTGELPMQPISLE